MKYTQAAPGIFMIIVGICHYYEIYAAESWIFLNASAPVSLSERGLRPHVWYFMIRQENCLTNE